MKAQMQGETSIDFVNFSIEYISLFVCQELDLIFKLNFSSSIFLFTLLKLHSLLLRKTSNFFCDE